MTFRQTSRQMAVPSTPEVRMLIAIAIRHLMAIDELRKYDPDQPRVPGGNPDGGRWTSDNGAHDATRDANTVVAARRKQNEAECDMQYKLDIALCRMVRTPLCYARAMDRYVACMGGGPIPPLQF